MTRLAALSILCSLSLPGVALAQLADGRTGSGGLGWLWWLGVAALVAGLFFLLFSPRAGRGGARPRRASR
ncbi:hypothetical protein [Anaeromyxobacter paludicola]|uniref:Uncharacterized protein n=1 Tax=Anaeromyxobacter paludicola TaxID=2918171 RepID=A0ABM7XC08_9BACT|nr:hypothetical protein [Anaeromyxobacter paludicola]BDG09397.1 hypothetical protein AMPC_25100 [Anaeromyxobacter paludicola]